MQVAPERERRAISLDAGYCVLGSDASALARTPGFLIPWRAAVLVRTEQGWRFLGLSRRDIDPDALKVLHRLRAGDHVAYLVGGSVRDLLLGRRPKDFDIGTSAHPYQVKRLFNNCWIIGRRFRLAHVRFGQAVEPLGEGRRRSLLRLPAGHT